MLHALKNRNFYIMVFGDMVLFAAAEVGAYLIRFDFTLAPGMPKQILRCLPYLLVVKVIIFYVFGTYRGMWRYSSLLDLWRLFKAAVFSSMVIVTLGFIMHRFQGYSRGVLVIDGFLTFLFTGAYRLLIRLLHNRGFLERLSGKERIPKETNQIKEKRVVLIGAGDAGEKTYREIRDNPNLGYHVVAFIDDDPGKKGFLIHGIPVIGPISELPQFVKELDIKEILITLPSASGPKMRKIVEICDGTSIPYKTLPGLGEIIDGKISIKALRDVNYNDLLGREEVRLNVQSIRHYIEGKRLLVTGAGGSIGSELCRQLIRFNPASLVLVDCSEANLYAIQMELEHKLDFHRDLPILTNIQYGDALNIIFEKNKPEVVVHAAAKKHVPLMESNPWEAVFNNIIGSWNVMEAAVTHGVQRFIMVSTDKAVRPTNIMGASKRVCELLMQTYQEGGNTVMMGVRFGNVVGSSGSVIPLFREQIAYGGPVTVTHPEVTRYFMTIPEATQLILQAGALGTGGEIFILKMGKPVKIVDMAKDLIRLSGKEPGRDIEIVFTGLRPGEKLYEELISEGEGIVATEHEKIMVLRPDQTWYGFNSRETYRDWLLNGILSMQHHAASHDRIGIREKMKELVPEYQPETTRDEGSACRGEVPIKKVFAKK